jgi:predicted HTH transcriptional regulator
MINTAKDLMASIRQGEGQIIEFKTSFQKDVIESIVAFTNARDGLVGSKLPMHPGAFR